jgi:16S rRNA (cytidine1402-2'-O)-methyltransferase
MSLFIVSTPIGNLEDITLRALKVLFTVPVILSEDTRRTGNLLETYRKKWPSGIPNAETQGIAFLRETKPRFISFHEHNEQQRIPEIIQLLKSGMDIALVSDAGTPLISDPGFKLIRRCLDEKIHPVPIPGPSAWITALTSSGQPTDRVFFLGYFSPRAVRRRKEIHQLKNAFSGLRKPPTIVFYESPHRLLTTLKDILEIAGNIEVTLASELTKLHEKIITLPVSLWIAELEQKKKIQGEYTVLFKF